METIWSRFATVIVDPSLPTIVAFCLIGALLSLNLILRFPDFMTVIEQYDGFDLSLSGVAPERDHPMDFKWSVVHVRNSRSAAEALKAQRLFLYARPRAS